MLKQSAKGESTAGGTGGEGNTSIFSSCINHELIVRMKFLVHTLLPRGREAGRRRGRGETVRRADGIP